MADYSELKAAIRAAIYDNTEQAITGEVLQDILVEMVDALGVPEGGIPASELTQAVQQALEKALSAYQKPGTGIPASDIADGVIPDVSQFITKTVTDLVHYYTKEETYTQQQVNDLIGAISQFHYEIYASLGDITSPASNVLYLIGPSGSGSDQYEEYVYANEAFTKIGDTSIDLSGYLRYTPQTLSDAEKLQARTNIGATAPEIFWATYGTTTAAEIDAAVAAGKLVAMVYNNGPVFFMQSVDGSTYYFENLFQDRLRKITLTRSNDAWSAMESIYVQNTLYRVQTLAGNETAETKYPSTKAVADALGKMGVISQTQTWTGSDAAGYDYTMSNLVRGLIPQANIDLYVAAGAVFNATTGYFELNGLTDISYNEMSAIYAAYTPNPWTGQQMMFGQRQVRTNLYPKVRAGAVMRFSGLRLCYEANLFEAVSFDVNPALKCQFNNMQLAFYMLKYLASILSVLDVNGVANYTQTFDKAFNLKDVSLYKLGASVSFPDSSRLSLASVVYMVDNAANTSAITITLHATAYARCQADTTEYTYNGQTYTGILAYAAARNITIASA